MGLQSFCSSLICSPLSIPNPKHFQVFYLFSFSSVPSNSPLADVASQSQENDNILNFANPTHEGKKSTALLHYLLLTKEEENSSCPRPMLVPLAFTLQTYFSLYTTPVFHRCLQ